MNKHKQDGFAHVWMVLILVVLVAAIGAAYWRVTNHQSSNSSTTTAGQITVQPQAKTSNEKAPSTTLDATKLLLGDGKVSNSPKQGYVYACNINFRGGGARHAGSWISGSSWNSTDKPHVKGDVSWPNASVSIKVQGAQRVVTTNDLPNNHGTGIFPISSSDPAYQYDTNPNSIISQSIVARLDANPSIVSSPSCVPMGAIGYMTNGVALYNALDDAGRDAAAHEIQDKCDGHPQMKGEYHYHNLSACFKDISSTDVIGYAMDGFAITGPKTSTDKYYSTADLDECHGMTSDINLDGKSVSIYHYVMTQDYPYSISCFKGTPVRAS